MFGKWQRVCVGQNSGLQVGKSDWYSGGGGGSLISKSNSLQPHGL